MGVKLYVRNGGLAGETFSFTENTISIGRDKSNLLRLAAGVDERASGRHCEIYEQGGTYFIRDLGSTNGTYVNGQRISSPVALKEDDLLKLGGARGIEIDFKLEHAAEPKTEITRDVGIRTLTPDAAPPTQNVSPKIDSSPLSVPHFPSSVHRPSSDGPRTQPVPMQKVGIGERTLNIKLSEAKAEFQREYSKRTWLIVALLGFVLLAGIGAGFFALKAIQDARKDIAGIDTKVNTVGNQLAAQEAKLEKQQIDIDGVSVSISTIKVEAAASQNEYRENLAGLTRAISEKEKRIADIQAKFDSGGTVPNLAQSQDTMRSEVAALQRMVDDMKSYQDKNKRFDNGEKGEFVSAADTNRKTIYAVLYKARNASKMVLLGTAFMIDREKGLLATSGNISNSVSAFMSKGQVFVVASNQPRYNYAIKKAFTHDGYATASSGKFSANVGVLEIESAADGKTVEPAPAAATVCADSDLYAVQTAQQLAMLGFPEEYKTVATAPQDSVLVSSFALGVASSFLAFDGNAPKERNYDILEHTCAIGEHDEGSPIFDAKGRVVAIQTESKTERVSVIDKNDPTKQTFVKLAVGNLRHGVSVRHLRDLVRKNYGEEMLK